MKVVWNGETEDITIREVKFTFGEPADLSEDAGLAKKVLGIPGFEEVPEETVEEEVEEKKQIEPTAKAEAEKTLEPVVKAEEKKAGGK